MKAWFYAKLEARGVSQAEFRRTRYLVPNWISYVRIILSPVPMILLLVGAFDTTVRWWAFGLFVGLALTDFVDGQLARRLDMRSKWGTVVDPIGDKLLVAFTIVAMLIVFWGEPLYGWLWAVVLLILAREIVLTEQIRRAQNSVTAPTLLGKLKTLVQMTLVAFWLAPVSWWSWVVSMLIGATIAVTLASWWQYYVRFVTPATRQPVRRHPW